MSIISTQDKGWILRRVKASGVPSYIALPVMQLFITWAENSGTEWAVSRFKAIKNDFVRLASGLTPVSTWIKSPRKGHAKFGGVIGVLEKWCMSSEAYLEPALSLLNIYTEFFAPEPTKAQKTKFLTAVHAPVILVPDSVKRAVLLGASIAKIKPLRKLRAASPLLMYNPSEGKRAPTLFGSRAEEDGIIDSIACLLTKTGKKHLSKYREYYNPVLLGLESEVMLGRNALPPQFSDFTGSTPQPLVAGNIGLIQEAGYKLRAVANPMRVFQQVLSPLGDSLFNLLRDLPWDCTFEQSKADSYLLRATAMQDRMVWSVDLSNATDYFPLELQVELLHALFPSDEGLVNLFEDVSRAYWKTSLPQPDLVAAGFSNPGMVSWTTGQPLGLYPSFASFALTHGLLLLGLLGRKWNGEFFILGDDVVILDDDLYSLYIQTLGCLGCPVSSQKTLSSKFMAEFHSTLYFKGKMVPNYKWRKVSDDSFLDLLKNNHRLLNLLTTRQKRVVSVISPLPESWGGLGWNPKGLSLNSRVDPWIPYLIRDKAGLEFLTDYSGRYHKMTWQSTLSKLTREQGIISNDETWLTTFDQKVDDLVRVSLGASLVPLKDVLGLNLNVVVSDADLPIAGVRKNHRRTVLENLESVIKTLPGVRPN